MFLTAIGDVWFSFFNLIVTQSTYMRLGRKEKLKALPKKMSQQVQISTLIFVMHERVVSVFTSHCTKPMLSNANPKSYYESCLSVWKAKIKNGTLGFYITIYDIRVLLTKGIKEFKIRTRCHQFLL